MPYIYEDRISQSDFTKTLEKAIKLPKTKYDVMSKAGMQHVNENYNFEQYEKMWVETMDEIVEKHGSWDTRVGYERWHLLEVA